MTLDELPLIEAHIQQLDVELARLLRAQQAAVQRLAVVARTRCGFATDRGEIFDPGSPAPKSKRQAAFAVQVKPLRLVLTSQCAAMTIKGLRACPTLVSGEFKRVRA